MSFFFPKTMAERALDIFEQGIHVSHRSRICRNPDLINRKDAIDFFVKKYNFECRRYCGLGFISSFIAGKAYDARGELSEQVDQFAQQLIKELNKENYPTLEKYYKIALFKGPILGKLLGWPLKVAIGVSVPYRYYRHENNYKISLIELICNLPILSRIYYGYYRSRPVNKIIAELIHDVCNPLRLVGQFLTFLHRVIDRALEIGSEEPTKRTKECIIPGKAGPILKFLKQFVGIIFSLVSFPLVILAEITDIPYQIVENVVYDPLKFIGASLLQAVGLGGPEPIMPESSTGSSTSEVMEGILENGGSLSRSRSRSRSQSRSGSLSTLGPAEPDDRLRVTVPQDTSTKNHSASSDNTMVFKM